MNPKDTIKINFSRYAKLYDAYSDIQNYVGSKLASYISPRCFDAILDIGCGTGSYTKLLRNSFPGSTIHALDISEKMIQQAKQKLKNEKIAFLLADAETASLDENFDLITSNACFQWLTDMETTITKYENLLKENGVIIFSTFGPLTLHELADSLEKLHQTNIPISSCRFIEKDRITQILEKYFDNTFVQDEILRQTYPSLWQFLSTIKYTGTRGLGLNGQSLKKSQMAELEKIYKQNFKDIVATYQIFYCRAQKRRPNR